MKTTENDFMKFGFKRQDITNILGNDFFSEQKILKTEEAEESSDKPFIKKTKTTCEGGQNKEAQPTEWAPRFSGKKHALEIISSLALALVEKSGNSYRRGEGISASAIAETVANMLDKTDTQSYRKLIAEALKYTNSEAKD